jgi:hypothetical protein
MTYADKGAIVAHLQAADTFWLDPKPLPSNLPTVAAFEPELVPVALRDWVMDIAERMQCPADYIAVSAMVAAGAVVGRKVGIRPQQHTDWVEVPNLWGCVVGRPGVMKSPAMAHALKPLRRLDARAADENTAKLAKFNADMEAYKNNRSAARQGARKGAVRPVFDDVEPTPPALKRYVVTDATYEALGVVMADNPNGVMAFRDELVSMLKPLDREENAPARGFFLSAWNGTEGYTFDRIMRGRTHIEACCLGLLGATQPARLTAYLGDAVRGGASDDGFVQRLGLLVWPDVSGDWRDIDREPDAEGRRRAGIVFDRLDALEPANIGADRDDFDPVAYLRFDPDALAEFRTWRDVLERRLRGGDLHDAMQSHLNKYRGLVPKLSLLFHLINGGAGAVGVPALLTALAWAEYLETHAARAYASVTSAKTSGARTIIAKLKSGALQSPFTARAVHQSNWSGLGDIKDVREALTLLVDFDWLSDEEVSTGGRPTTIYTVNPKVLR